jgi:hypothetical protein
VDEHFAAGGLDHAVDGAQQGGFAGAAAAENGGGGSSSSVSEISSSSSRCGETAKETFRNSMAALIGMMVTYASPAALLSVRPVWTVSSGTVSSFQDRDAGWGSERRPGNLDRGPGMAKSESWRVGDRFKENPDPNNCQAGFPLVHPLFINVNCLVNAFKTGKRQFPAFH